MQHVTSLGMKCGEQSGLRLINLLTQVERRKERKDKLLCPEDIAILTK